MATETRALTVIASMNAELAELDNGGTLEVWDNSGTPTIPTIDTVDPAASNGSVLLSTHTLNTPRAYQDATGIDGGIITATSEAINSADTVAAGTIGFGRLKTSGDVTIRQLGPAELGGPSGNIPIGTTINVDPIATTRNTVV